MKWLGFIEIMSFGLGYMDGDENRKYFMLEISIFKFFEVNFILEILIRIEYNIKKF